MAAAATSAPVVSPVSETISTSALHLENAASLVTEIRAPSAVVPTAKKKSLWTLFLPNK